MHAKLRSASRLVALALAAMLVGCGSSEKLVKSAGATGAGSLPSGRSYVGVATCKGCHGDTHAEWAGTLHSKAWATLKGYKQDKNTGCIGCHTVGYDATKVGKPGYSGFVSEAQTPGLTNVQCESCHGAGSEHAAKPSADNITKKVAPATCGGCHTDAHHPTYDEFSESAHAGSLHNNLPPKATPGWSTTDNSRTKCLVCHTTEGFFYQLSQPVMVATRALLPKSVTRQATPPPGLQAATTDIVCYTCHDPHVTKKADDHQLRMGKKELCETCHRTAGFGQASFFDSVPITASPGHGQGAIFDGYGALMPTAAGTVGGAAMTAGVATYTNPYWAPGTPGIPVVNSAHKAATTADGCATCHVYGETVASPTEGNPNNTGHTFEPNYRSCTGTSGCHTAGARAITANADPAIMAKATQVQADFTAKLAAVKRYVTTSDALYINPLKAKTAGGVLMSTVDRSNYDVAVWDYNLINRNDNSKGIHNTKYSMLTLQVALDTLSALKAKYPSN